MSREHFNIVRAITMEESPCTDCIRWRSCYRNDLACEAFENYYETGEIKGEKEPTNKIYKGIFNVRFRSA